MINPESYQRYLENERLQEYNSKIIREYVFDMNRDMVLEPKDQAIREYLRNRVWNF